MIAGAEMETPAYGLWDTTPTHTRTSPDTDSSDHSTLFHDPFSLHFPIDSSNPFVAYHPLVTPLHSEEGDTFFHSSLRSPSPFPAALLTPSEPDVSADTASSHGSASPVRSLSSQPSSPTPSLPPSPAPSTLAASSVSVTSSSPPPATAPVKRRRERILGLTREQRTERKRALHRQIDASRRQKEIVALDSLRQLVTRQAALSSGNIEGGEEEEERAAKREKQSGDGEVEEGVELISKAAVLESSAELIRQL